MDARLDLRMMQKLIMTPQLQQAIKLLQMHRMELSQMINQVLLENPVLEETLEESAEMQEEESSALAGTGKEAEEGAREEETEVSPLDGTNFQWEDYFDEDRSDGRDMGHLPEPQTDAPTYEQTLSRPGNLFDHLLWQLHLTTQEGDARQTGELIIGNIDENGYLQATIEELTALTGTSQEGILNVIRLIQGFDPVGVGARDVRECLLIQLDFLGLRGSIAWEIIANHLEDFEKKKYPVLSKKLGATLEEIYVASKVIEGLEPKPGRPFQAVDNAYIIPDVYVFKHEGDYIIVLNEDGMPRLKINPVYRKMMRGGGALSDQEKGYLEDKFRSAVWLIRSIEQRNHTIYKTAVSIIKYQREFLDKGISFLKPLTLRQIAEDIQMHESTVSRVTTNKYISTPRGIFELKYFFSSGVARSNGENCSSVSVRDMIRKLVLGEDLKYPYSDQQIMEYLKANHIEIARRTIAKYRKELQIPSAVKRKKLF
jgi:RNA polymerase sigma-54 factor